MSLAKEARKTVDRMAVIEACDSFAGVRNGLRKIAEDEGLYSGLPIPLDNTRLVIEPTFKYKDGLDKCGEQREDECGTKVRNVWWCSRKGCYVGIGQDPDGKVWWAPLLGSGTHMRSLFNTLNAADVWGIEQEAAAIETLGKLLRHRQFKQYLLTGTFLESGRSGVKYFFRKLRPTVAVRCTGDDSKILCTLCMHPIGYYEESWAGCMCPTDDVIAHLLLMRGDEKMFWRRCNQHGPDRPESGL